VKAFQIAPVGPWCVRRSECGGLLYRPRRHQPGAGLFLFRGKTRSALGDQQADQARGPPHGGELRQAAGAAAPKGRQPVEGLAPPQPPVRFARLLGIAAARRPNGAGHAPPKPPVEAARMIPAAKPDAMTEVVFPYVSEPPRRARERRRSRRRAGGVELAGARKRDHGPIPRLGGLTLRREAQCRQ